MADEGNVFVHVVDPDGDTVWTGWLGAVPHAGDVFTVLDEETRRRAAYCVADKPVWDANSDNTFGSVRLRVELFPPRGWVRRLSAVRGWLSGRALHDKQPSRPKRTAAVD